jgi:apolipoprotein N-acyltransferase
MTRANWTSDLIVWPETALPAFYHQAKNFLEDLGLEARANGTDLLIGLPVMDLETRRYFNSMVSVGSREAFYYKQHLVPFGEFIPFRSVLGGVLDFLKIPLSDFSTSDGHHQVLTVAGQQVGISICYEDAFGEEIIQTLPQATLLVNVSNDAWFGESVAPHQHLQMARMRALETGRPLLRATNTGVTAIIGSDGNIQSRARQFVAADLTDQVQPMHGSTPYVRTGNIPIVLILVIGLISGMMLGNRISSSRTGETSSERV